MAGHLIAAWRKDLQSAADRRTACAAKVRALNLAKGVAAETPILLAA